MFPVLLQKFHKLLETRRLTWGKPSQESSQIRESVVDIKNVTERIEKHSTPVINASSSYVWNTFQFAVQSA